MKNCPMGFDPKNAASARMPVRQRPSALNRVKTTMTATETRYFVAIPREGQRALPLSDVRGVVRGTC